MQDVTLKNKFLYAFIILLIVIFFSLFVLTLHEHFKNHIISKSPSEEKKDVIKESGLVLKTNEYYIALNGEINIEIDNPKNVKYEIDIENKDIADFVEDKLIAKGIGKTPFKIKIEKEDAFSGTIYVVNGLRLRTELFDKKKKFISCNEFSEEENDI